MSTSDTTNYEALRRYVKRITPIMLYKANLPIELTDDVSQSAFLRFAGVSEERKRQIINKEAYLRSIIANVINDHIKREVLAKCQYVEESDYKLLDNAAITQPDDVHFRVLLEQVLKQLSSDERLLLKFLSLNFKGKELAARLGVSEPAARKRTSRLRVKLKELLLSRNV